MPSLRCEKCQYRIEFEGEIVIHSRRADGSCYHYYICSECFDIRAYKDIKNCPKCFVWHDDNDHCPKCGVGPVNVNRIIHEFGRVT